MRVSVRLFVMMALMPVSSFAQTIQVKLNPQTEYRAPRGQIRFEMVVTQPDGAVAQRNAASQWTSSNPDLATINQNGQWTTSGNPAFRGNLTFTVTYRMPDLEMRTVIVPVRIE